ncbi:MAG: hypothetical protein M1815_004468 [Lichina confinis]|nr:MAG: hypothetical protein M1815_004468 [Lichina confinis]
MDEAPPTYAEAVSRDPWSIIGPYVESRDLHAACLVSRHWNKILTAHLWEEPLFATSPDGDGYLRLLSQDTQLPVRLPNEWLAILLASLPSLSSIILPGCSFLDHASIQLLLNPERATSKQSQDSSPQLPASSTCRLLDVRGCQNIVPVALAELLSSRFRSLIFLDISSIPGLRGSSFWRGFSMSIPNVEVLKLRNVKLVNADLETLARSLGTRIWSLDVRGNMLGDESAEALVNYCFPPPAYTQAEVLYDTYGSAEDDRAAVPGRAGATVDSFQRGIQDDAQSIAAWLRRGWPADPLPGAGDGLTHLYISNNKISVEGATRLLKASRLRVLDVGRLSVPQPLGTTLSGYVTTEHSLAISIQSMIPAVRDYAWSTLVSLRVSHHLVTGCGMPVDCAPFKSNSSSPQDAYRLAGQISFLEKLVLTDVPSHGRSVATALVAFIKGCAHTAQSAEARDTSQATPPRETRAEPADDAAFTRQIRPVRLRTIQLEMAAARSTPRHGWPPGVSSVTEDDDSDAFLRASANDFSFFSEESSSSSTRHHDSHEHQQQHDYTPSTPPRRPTVDERVSISSGDPTTIQSRVSSERDKPPRSSPRGQRAPEGEQEEDGEDVIKTLTAFRTDRRSAAATAVVAAQRSANASASPPPRTLPRQTLPSQAPPTPTLPTTSPSTSPTIDGDDDDDDDNVIAARAREHWRGTVGIVRAVAGQ